MPATPVHPAARFALGQVMLCLLLPAVSLAQQPVALVNVNVVPMDSARTLSGQTIIVRGSLIEAIGPAASTPIPEGSVVVDGGGAWVMPGLADMHVHFRRDETELLLYVMNGVTTVRELSGSPLSLQWRREIQAGVRIGPNLIISSPSIRGITGRRARAIHLAGMGTVSLVCFALLVALGSRVAGLRRRRVQVLVASALLAGAAGYAAAVLVLPFPDRLLGRGGLAKWHAGSVAEAAHAVRRGAEQYDQIKLYEGLTRRQFIAATTAARAEGVHTVGHIPEALGLELAFGRMDELAHAYFLVVEMLATTDTTGLAPGPALEVRYARRMDEIVAAVRRAGIGVTATLMPVPEVRQLFTDSAAFAARPDLPYRYRPFETMASFRAGMRLPDSVTSLRILDAHVRWGAAATVALVRSGAPVYFGTDASPTTVLAGFSAHDELRLLVEYGLTPWQVLRTATAAPGEANGGVWGTIAPGRRADLVLVDANPLLGVETLRRPRGVLVSGRWYGRSTLDSLDAAVRRRRAEQSR